MYVYKVTFKESLKTEEVRANSPRECVKIAEQMYGQVVSHIKYLRGK